MPRKKQPELTFQQHIAAYLVREHQYGVLEQSDITDTEHFIAEDHLRAFLKATQADTLKKLEDDYGTDARDEVFKSLRKELEHTPLWMLMRHGLKVRGLEFRLFYPKPRSAESAATAKHAENRITFRPLIKRSIYEKEPWVAQTLYKAFCQSKEICMRDLYDTNILRVSLPWTSAEYEDTTALMTTDYWPYGLEPNRKNLETLNGYLFEQGLIKQKLNLDELFARETVEAFKI